MVESDGLPLLHGSDCSPLDLLDEELSLAQPRSTAPSFPDASLDSPTSHQSLVDELSEAQSKPLLAAQFQKSKDGKLKQEQIIEHASDTVTRLTQRQELLEGKVAQEIEVSIRVESSSDGSGKEDIEVDVVHRNFGGGPGSKRQVHQVNQVEVIERCQNCASETHSSGSMARPHVSKDALSVVNLRHLLERRDPLPLTTSASTNENEHLLAPAVLLTFNDMTYCLFEPYEASTEENTLLLFEDVSQHRLYFNQVETLLQALHEAFPQLTTKHDELILNLEDLGISLPEDNVYSREVSLHDLDRIHVGCGLPGRLRIKLEVQPRFPTGFNALLRHIANSRHDSEHRASSSVDGVLLISGEDSDAFGDDELEDIEEGMVTDDQILEDDVIIFDEDGGVDEVLQPTSTEPTSLSSSHDLASPAGGGTASPLGAKDVIMGSAHPELHGGKVGFDV
ncbi:hypothetical protein T439DRAFT_348062 [Meredithblackwellia eburnea MCA 4105]